MHFCSHKVRCMSWKRLSGRWLLGFLLGTISWVGLGEPVLYAQQTGSSATSNATSEPGVKNLFWQPPQLQQGSPVFFTVEFTRVPRKVTGTWIDKTVTFFPSENPKIWFALAGDDLEIKPGTYEMKVTAVLPGGKVVKLAKPVDVAAANFKAGAVDVPENFVEPNDAEKKQIARDEVLKAQAYRHVTPKPLWSGNFIKPVNGVATDSFGESRVLNEERTSTHRGTDFEVKEGTPVLVSNSGTVVLAKELFYEGQCVIVDHGERFFTIYMHLSETEVHVGQKLRKGEQVGRSGATGRVTGPHLHMGARWNAAYLDPVQLLALTLPKTEVHKSR